MATRPRDYYEVLGVPRTATDKEIKAAYRKLARQHHPDVNPDNPDAAERFKEISEAREVLGDPEKRKRYDQLGADWRREEAGPTAGGPDGSPGRGPGVEYRTVDPEDMEDLFGAGSRFSDYYHEIFGNARGAGRRGGFGVGPIAGEDVEGETTISLEEAYRGTTRTLELETPEGRRRVEVRIPPGVRDGGRVRAAGQGGPGLDGGPPGDLYLRVRIPPHPAFRREGDDLFARVPVPLDVALLGGEVTAPTPRGTSVALRVPPGTQNGTRLRLRGLGMPRPGGSGYGDLYAEVDVRLPVPVPPEARELAERLRAERTGDDT
ncbi:MAG: J domain-containing protein [Chloroflexi bacterium]|nr:MAG: J domain-containing protein [Chloroflexota bacterium]